MLYLVNERPTGLILRRLRQLHHLDVASGVWLDFSRTCHSIILLVIKISGVIQPVCRSKDIIFAIIRLIQQLWLTLRRRCPTGTLGAAARIA